MDKEHKGERKESPSERRFGGIKEGLSNLADALAEQMYQHGFLPVLKLNDCVQYYKDHADEAERKAAGFVLSVKKNPDPRNENDSFVIVQGLVDENNKPIIHNGETVSRIVHAGTLDEALVKAMDGKESRVFRL